MSITCRIFVNIIEGCNTRLHLTKLTKMCIIIVKQHKQKLPTSNLKRSAQINRHGLGIVWLDTFEVSYHNSNEWKLLKTERPFIAHFRFATIGKVGRENTHPFVCGKNTDELLMMNGTISELGNWEECDTKILANKLGDVPRHLWKEKLSQYDCRFVTINKRTRTFQMYNKPLWTKDRNTWYSKDNVIQENLVAVYGTLKKGYGNNYLLRGSSYIGKGETKRRYPMVASGIPYVLDNEGEGHNIDVELYAVSNTTLNKLDSLEGHPNWYRRRQIDIRINGKIWSAWLYFNIKEKVNGRPLLKSFSRPAYHIQKPQRFTFADTPSYTPQWRLDQFESESAVQQEGQIECPDCHEPLTERTPVDFECIECCTIWPIEQLREKGITL